MSTGILEGNVFGSYLVQVPLTPSAVSTITTSEQTFTVPHLKATDFVTVNPPSDTTGVALVSARVSANNTLALTWANPTAGSLTPPSGNYLLNVIRPSSGKFPLSIGD